MADSSTPSQSGAKQPGVLSESVQKQKDTNIRGILSAWNISSLDDAFPVAIKPSYLGVSALSNIRAISLRTDLASARVLFINECKDANGAPITLGFGHTARILKALSAVAAMKEAAHEEGDDDEQLASTGDKPKRRRRTSAGPKMAVGTPNDPTGPIFPGLATPSKDLAAPSTYGSTSPSKNTNKVSFSKPNTRGVALPTFVDDVPSSKPTKPHDAFAFLNDKGSPTAPSLKRPYKAGFSEKGESQADGPIIKKVKKQCSLQKAVGESISKPQNGESKPIRHAVDPLGLLPPLKGETEQAVQTIEVPESHHNLDEPDDKFAELAELMKTEKAEREKLLSTQPSKPAPSNPFTAVNGEVNEALETNKPMLTSTTMKDGEKKNSLDTLNLASTMANEIIESDEDTIVVDVEGVARARSLDAAMAISRVKQCNKEVKLTRSESPVRATGRNVFENGGKQINYPIIKTAGIAPIATMVTGRAHENPVQGLVGKFAGIRKATENAAMVSSLQDSNHLKRHCESVVAQAATLLGPKALADMADWGSPQQQALAQDLKAAFETAMRHLESDIAFVLKKHGDGL